MNEEQEQDKELESGVKLSIERGRPYGSEKWVQRMAGTLNLRQSLRPRGRPVGWRKAKDKGERGKCRKGSAPPLVLPRRKHSQPPAGIIRVGSSAPNSLPKGTDHDSSTPIRAVFLAIAILFSIVFAVAPARAEDPRFPWSSNHHPSDVARDHVEDITKAAHHYVVTQGGTMDGLNCRSPMGCGMNREGASSNLGVQPLPCAWRTSDRMTW